MKTATPTSALGLGRVKTFGHELSDVPGELTQPIAELGAL